MERRAAIIDTIRRMLILCLLPAVARSAPARADDVARHEYNRVVMGGQARIVLYARSEEDALLAARAAFARLDELDAVMSDYRDDSELMRLCVRAGGDPVPVSDDLFNVLKRSVEIAEATGGAFDPTLGPLTTLWRDARRRNTRPAAGVIDETRARTGYEKIILDPAARTVRLTQPGMRLDLGGIGKGYAAQEALETLNAHGISIALVDLGGDVVVGDPPPGRTGWTVTVVTHDPDHPESTLTLANAAVATSGDLEQFVEIDGVRYSHILDPATGLGLTNRTAATVIASDGATADALASAMCVLGPDTGLAHLERFPKARAIVAQWTAAGVQRRLSPGFSAN